MALRRIGNQLVLEGVGKYISDSEKVNKAIEKNNAALKKQTEVAAKTALNNKSLEEQSKSLGRRMTDAFTAPFRLLGKMLANTIKGALNFAKTVITSPFKILGMLISNVFKGVIVALITTRLTSWIFGGQAPIPASWKAKIGSGLTSIFQKVGGESGLKFWKAFQEFGSKYFSGQIQKILSSAIGMTTGGPLGSVTNRIVGSVFSGFGKIQRFSEAMTDNKSWGTFAKNLAGGGGSAIKNISTSLKSATLDVAKFGATMLKSIGPSVTGVIAKGLASVASSLGPLAIGLAAVVAALVGFKIFTSLGKRGAGFEGIIASFDILSRQAQQFPQTLLENMRKAANGTIADLDLITNANLALAGATGETAKLVGEGLPKLLEIARAQSRSTGKDVNFLFNSLVEGVKKAQPELIDNTGLLVRIGEANEELAKKLGKSVEALSAQERQQAILNATLKAGEAAVKQLNGAELTAAEIQQQIDANRKNTLDALALAVQPAYKVFLTLQRTISEVILNIVKFIAPFIYKVGQIISEFANGVSGVINRVSKVFNPVIERIVYAAAILSLAFDYIKWNIKAMFMVINYAIDQLGAALNWIGDQLLKIFPFLKAFQDNIFIGGAKAFGALAAGILQAANKYIFPAIIDIATFIADFLMGESPPPKGPLSRIDEGGANVMQAWLSGVTGVSLEPVSQVAQQVTTMLGSVATYSLEQIKARLAELDYAVQPFQDRLDLIQARLDALSKPLERARDMIAKRLDSAVAILTSGGGNAAEVRALDQQLDLINQRLEMNDDELQQAQLQLELAQALQAEERAALAIRERMLGTTEDIADATSTATDRPTGGGGGESSIAQAPGLAPLLGGGSVGDSILGLDKINEALGNIKDAAIGSFQDAGGDAALAEAKDNIKKINEQSLRIDKGVSNIAGKITDPFKGLGETIGGFFEEAKNKFDEYFGEDGKITTAISGIGTSFSELFGQEGSIYKMFVGDESIFAKITGKFNEVFGPESPLALLFGEGGLFGTGGSIEKGFASLFGPADTEGTLLNQLDTFKESFGNIFAGIFTDTDSPLQKAISAVSGAVDTIWSWFNALTDPSSPYSISEAFSALKNTLLTTLVYPVVDAVEAMVNGIIDYINKAIATVWDNMPGVVKSAASTAGLNLGNFNIDHVDLPYPTFHEGGVVRANLLKGEGVLSIPMMKTLSRLDKMMQLPNYSPPVIIQGSGQTQSMDRSVNIENINYHEQQRSARRTIRELRHLATMNGI